MLPQKSAHPCSRNWQCFPKGILGNCQPMRCSGRKGFPRQVNLGSSACCPAPSPERDSEQWHSKGTEKSAGKDAIQLLWVIRGVRRYRNPLLPGSGEDCISPWREARLGNSLCHWDAKRCVLSGSFKSQWVSEHFLFHFPLLPWPPV